VVASETSSCVSSRGVYHLPLASYDKHPSRQLTSYDVVAPPWAYAPDVEFEAQDRHPGLLGEFVWTGFDYLGEPTPYFSGRHGARPDDPDWPARSSYFGIVDLAGFPKDRYFLYQSVWATQPMVHVLPHWNWAGHEGRPIPVMVYTNAEEAELWLNGRSLGRRRRGEPPVALPVGPNVSGEGTFASRYRLLWEAPYEPGVLRAVALSGGRPVAEAQVRTAGRAAKLHVTADRGDLRADGDDLAFVSVRVEDDSGNLCPLADNLVRFSIEGAARLAGVDNGDPATVEPFQASQRHAFGGLCLAIVRPDRGAAGTIRLVATSDGLQSADVVLTAR
ncbi:MAG TPA: DUF4982 domain-containing protein, partial [Polyangiaceae bacterium]|nr:DUF4982 domain-containing protein [Polyangiaceae bacterium]